MVSHQKPVADDVFGMTAYSRSADDTKNVNFMSSATGYRISLVYMCVCVFTFFLFDKTDTTSLLG